MKKEVGEFILMNFVDSGLRENRDGRVVLDRNHQHVIVY